MLYITNNQHHRYYIIRDWYIKRTVFNPGEIWIEPIIKIENGIIYTQHNKYKYFNNNSKKTRVIPIGEII